MEAIEIARKLADYGQKAEACRAYVLAIHESGGRSPEEELEAAAYILQAGGNYKISYTCFRDLYNRGCFREETLSMMTAAFYTPNVKLLRSRYEKNIKLLKRYPYLFRKDFLPFEELPVRYYPYDDNSYTPFYADKEQFGEFIDFKDPVVSRNFFKDLEKPVLAADVYSQYELEYLDDNVRPSEYIGRENHIYLHYTDWGAFCSALQCLNLRPILMSQKIVFLIEDEISQYPIDFKSRFGLDYSQYTVRPIGIREVNRMIWHTQLSSHNGGDFFNEVFDGHPNLICMPSLMLDSVEKSVKDVREAVKGASTLHEMMQAIQKGKPRVIEELYRLRDRTDKDYMIAMFLCDGRAISCTDPSSRIAPALFFQPHFSHIEYQLRWDEESGRAVLFSNEYEKIRKSPLFLNFKYIKTFTPMRRITTSHAATVRFMYIMSQYRNKRLENGEESGEKPGIVNDAVSIRVLNRSFMIDWQDRLYHDSVLVRFEDGKLNPNATFRALAAFLDLPYTESMTYCSEYGDRRGGEAITKGNAAGFDPVTVYRTYDEFANTAERYYIEYFLRDAYQFYGYDFHYYDGGPVDKAKVDELVDGFTTINAYMRETWQWVYQKIEVKQDGEVIGEEIADAAHNALLENHMRNVDIQRRWIAGVLLDDLRFINKNGQPLRMMPRLELDPALLEQPLYH